MLDAVFQRLGTHGMVVGDVGMIFQAHHAAMDFNGGIRQAGEMVKTEIKAALQNEQNGLSQIARTIAKKHGLPKNEVYDLALKIKGLSDGD
ncbi:MAG: hypothetical protein P8X80_13270 [Desulfobacterales bacterium]